MSNEFLGNPHIGRTNKALENIRTYQKAYIEKVVDEEIGELLVEAAELLILEYGIILASKHKNSSKVEFTLEEIRRLIPKYYPNHQNRQSKEEK